MDTNHVASPQTNPPAKKSPSMKYHGNASSLRDTCSKIMPIMPMVSPQPSTPRNNTKRQMPPCLVLSHLANFNCRLSLIRSTSYVRRAGHLSEDKQRGAIRGRLPAMVGQCWSCAEHITAPPDFRQAGHRPVAITEFACLPSSS